MPVGWLATMIPRPPAGTWSRPRTPTALARAPRSARRRYGCGSPPASGQPRAQRGGRQWPLSRPGRPGPAARAADDLLGDAAAQGVEDAVAYVRGHYDQVCCELVGGVE